MDGIFNSFAEPARDEDAALERQFRSGSLDELRFDEEVDRLISRLLAREAISSSEPYDALARERAPAATPERALAPADYLRRLEGEVIEHAINTASPRFIGHMTTALPHFVRPLSRLLAALNQNPVKIETSKALTILERETLAMLHRQLYGLDEALYEAHTQDSESTFGMIGSGGTTANLCALWVARNAALGPAPGFAGVAGEGLAAALVHYGQRRAVIVGSELAHYSLGKAADLLGLGERGFSQVPVDARGRVELAALRRTLVEHRSRSERVLAVVGVAGTTESGAIDPLAELAELAAEFGAHFHVDAAWGGPLAFSSRHRGLLAGLERADSITIDGHKQLYMPMGIGAVLFRDPQRAAVIEKRARYIIRAGSPDLGRRSLEGSRASMVLLLHAGLHLLGRRGYGELLDAGLERARGFAEAIRRRPAFELVVEPTTNIVNYRYLPGDLRERAVAGALTSEDERRLDELNVSLQIQQRERGRSFVSRTTLPYTHRGRGSHRVVLRAVLANPLTQPSDLEAVLDEQEDLAATLERAGADQ